MLSKFIQFSHENSQFFNHKRLSQEVYYKNTTKLVIFMNLLLNKSGNRSIPSNIHFCKSKKKGIDKPAPNIRKLGGGGKKPGRNEGEGAFFGELLIEAETTSRILV